MKRSQSKDAPSGDPPKGIFLSWNRAIQPRCLRVELANGTFFALPYQHLGCVRFEPGNDETVNVTISGHKVKITGQHLRELGLAFQKLAVDWVKELPVRYATTSNREDVYIVSIAVTEIQGPQ
jgi:hypothetical protein